MIPIARRRRLLLGVLVGASLGQAALAAIIAFCIQRVFDSVLAPGGVGGATEMLSIGLVFAASALTAAGLETFRSWAGEKLGLGYVGEVREALFDTIMHASPAVLSHKRQGGLLLPFVGDLTAIKKWVSDGLVRLISATATSLLLIGLLAVQNLSLALAAGAVVVAAGLAVVWLSDPLNQAIRETRARRGAIANFVSSSIRAAQTIQSFNRFPREAGRLKKRNDALMRAGLRLATVSGAMAAIVHLAAAFLVASILIVGVIEVRNGRMTLGLVAAAISIAGLLAGAVRDLGVSFELWRRAKVSFAKVGAALALQPSVSDGEARRRLAVREASIQLDSVTVEGILDRVSVEAGPGAVVNIVGDSGSGKSTLLAVIARLRDPDRGRVRIDGRNLRRATLTSIRRRIGIASAGTPLMRGSIAMNLRYRWPSASEEEVARVIRVCNVAPVLERFPDGEAARLGEGAPELSLGEVQRLLIARAMVGQPPILLLDDVDTHLDAETAAAIAAELKAYPGTVVMAATTPALRRAANVIWRIENGQVRVESGKATELLRLAAPDDPQSVGGP